MLSQTAEYALRAVVWLADHSRAPLTTQEIARATHVPTDYLSKVLQALGRAGLVEAQRGKHGGFVLAKPPAGITILEVVNAVDPVRRIRTCPLGLRVHGHRLCPLHQKLDEAAASVEQALAGTVIADLLEESSPSRPLCEAAEVVNA